MTTVLIPVTEAEVRALREIGAQSGKSPEALLREALDEYLVRHGQQAERLQRLRQARGIWEGRDDLPSLETLRREMDRFSPRATSPS